MAVRTNELEEAVGSLVLAWIPVAEDERELGFDLAAGDRVRHRLVHGARAAAASGREPAKAKRHTPPSEISSA